MRLKLNDQDICTMYSHGLNSPEMCAYKYCYNRGIGKVIAIDPKEFCKWMAKNSHNGKAVSDRHSWRAIRNLCDRGFGEIIRDGFGRIELVLFSLDFVCGRIREPETKMPEPDPEKSDSCDNAEKNSVKQQQLIQIKQICSSVGINYRLEKDWWEIASHGVEKIKTTVKAMLLQISRGRTKIKNPPGWFKIALQDNYYLDIPDELENPVIFERMLILAKNKLIQLTGSIPQELDLYAKKNDPPTEVPRGG